MDSKLTLLQVEEEAALKRGGGRKRKKEERGGEGGSNKMILLQTGLGTFRWNRAAELVIPCRR